MTVEIEKFKMLQREGKIRMMLIKRIIRVDTAVLSEYTPYTYEGFEKQPTRYHQFYRMATEDDRKKIVELENARDKLFMKLTKLKKSAFERGLPLKKEDFEKTWELLGKQKLLEYVKKGR